MIFAKVDVGLPRHHRFLRIPKGIRAESLGVWLTATCYTRDEQLDGFCPAEALDAIASDAALSALIDVGLFKRSTRDGVEGFVVLKYAEHNETKAEIQSRMEADRKRKGKRSATVQKDSGQSPGGIQQDSVGIPGSDSDSGSVSDLDLTKQDHLPVNEAPAVVATRRSDTVVSPSEDGAFGMAVGAWSEGVQSVVGTRTAMRLRGSSLRALLDGLEQRPEGADAVAWARAAGVAYAAAKRGTTLSGFGFGDWIGSGGHVPSAASPPLGATLTRPQAAVATNPASNSKTRQASDTEPGGCGKTWADAEALMREVGVVSSGS